MDRPTTEEFAQAPLFRPHLPVEEIEWTDHSGDSVVIGGSKLTRENTETGMRFLLEGVPVLEAVPVDVDGERHWEGTFFDGVQWNAPFADEAEAAAEFVILMRDFIEMRDDELAFHMEENGVEWGRDWAEVRRGYNYDDSTAMDDRLGPSVRIVRRGPEAWVEGEEAPRPWREVAGDFMRVGENGNVLVPADFSLVAQHQYLSRAGDGAERHLDDLRGLRELAGNGADVTLYGRADSYMFDMMDSGAKDTVVPQEAIREYAEKAARSPLRLTNVDPALRTAFAEILGPEELIDPTNPPVPVTALRPLEEVYSEKSGAPLMQCQEVRTYPAYFQEQLRFVARHFLAPHVGDYPMEKLVRAQPPMGDQAAERAFLAFWEEGELVKEIGTFRFDAIPELRNTAMGRSDYQTSVARVWRRDGWDAVVFSDFAGVYAYARPTPRLEHDLDYPEAPRAPGM